MICLKDLKNSNRSRSCDFFDKVTHKTSEFRFCSVTAAGDMWMSPMSFSFVFIFIFVRYFPSQNGLTLFLWNKISFIFLKIFKFLFDFWAFKWHLHAKTGYSTHFWLVLRFLQNWVMTSQELIDFSIGYSYKFTSFETLNFQIPYNPLHDSYSKVSSVILQFLTITENLDIYLN